jgi:hypothetical protein
LARSKEVKVTRRELELEVLSEGNMIMLADLTDIAPKRRVLFEKKQKMVQDRS